MNKNEYREDILDNISRKKTKVKNVYINVKLPLNKIDLIYLLSGSFTFIIYYRYMNTVSQSAFRVTLASSFLCTPFHGPEFVPTPL